MGYSKVVMLLFDGARYDVFSDLLNNGSLPNIKKYIVSEGLTLQVSHFVRELDNEGRS